MTGIIINLVLVIIWVLVLTHLCDKKGEKLWMGFVIAFCGFNVGGGVMKLLVEPYINKEAIIECQKDLPRSQKCVLIAIPEENKYAE